MNLAISLIVLFLCISLEGEDFLHTRPLKMDGDLTVRMLYEISIFLDNKSNCNTPSIKKFIKELDLSTEEINLRSKPSKHEIKLPTDRQKWQVKLVDHTQRLLRFSGYRRQENLWKSFRYENTLYLEQANPMRKTLFSIIIPHHNRIMDELEMLSYVDKNRIGVYRLPYVGETAMREPALIPRYCLSICSTDFNERIKKYQNLLAFHLSIYGRI